MKSDKEHKILFAENIPAGVNNWDNGVWGQAPELSLEAVRPESLKPYPITSVKILYDSNRIHLFYRVHDNFMKCTQKKFLGPVHFDSCVEFFVRPEQDCGYFNFEFNCAGVLNGSFIEDWTITERGFAKMTEFNEEDRDSIAFNTSIQGFIEDEIQEPTTWWFKFSIPFSLFERYLDKKISPQGSAWEGNFFKCGSRTSHPHWCSWTELDKLNFHAPESFGKLYFQ